MGRCSQVKGGAWCLCPLSRGPCSHFWGAKGEESRAHDLSRTPAPGPLSLTDTCNFCLGWDAPATSPPPPPPAAAEDVRTNKRGFCFLGHALAFCQVPFEDKTPQVGGGDARGEVCEEEGLSDTAQVPVHTPPPAWHSAPSKPPPEAPPTTSTGTAPQTFAPTAMGIVFIET